MLEEWLNKNISKEKNLSVIPRKVRNRYMFEIKNSNSIRYGDYAGFCTKYLLRAIDLKLTDNEQEDLRREMGLYPFNNSMIEEICDGI